MEPKEHTHDTMDLNQRVFTRIRSIQLETCVYRVILQIRYLYGSYYEKSTRLIHNKVYIDLVILHPQNVSIKQLIRGLHGVQKKSVLNTSALSLPTKTGPLLEHEDRVVRSLYKRRTQTRYQRYRNCIVYIQPIAYPEIQHPILQ